MSDTEKKILEAITKAIPNMSDFNRGYLLGMGEAISGNKINHSSNDEASDRESDESGRVPDQES